MDILIDVWNIQTIAACKIKKQCAGVYNQLELPPFFLIVFNPQTSISELSISQDQSGMFWIKLLKVAFCFNVRTKL